MIYSCSCPSCGQPIEYEVEDYPEGVNATCPRCRASFAPGRTVRQAAPRPPAVTPTSPVSRNQPGEAAFFHADGVVVTKTRFINGAETFALATITSVRMFVIPPRRNEGVVLFIVGTCIGIPAFAGIPILYLLVEPGSFTWRLPVLLAIIMVGGACLGWFGYKLVEKAKPTYAVALTTAAAETSVYMSQHQARVQAVVDAINEAIVARG